MELLRLGGRFRGSLKTEGRPEQIRISESKGEHLFGNKDSKYKKQVLDLMTEPHKTNRIERYQMKQLALFQVNEKVECYFVEENKEEESLRNLLK